METSNGDEVYDLDAIKALDDYQSRLKALLLRRQRLTERLSQHGKCYPPLVLDRARTYEALDYDDLAAFDAYAVYMLCQKNLSDEFVTDLEAHDMNGELWEPDTDEVRCLIVDAVAVLVRCLRQLGATKDAAEKLDELHEQLSLLGDTKTEAPSLLHLLRRPQILYRGSDVESIQDLHIEESPLARFGASRREIYPWSTYEPDRNSPESVLEINQYLSKIAPNLEAKVTELPALDSSGNTIDEKWYQLGLFAKQDLQPGEEILHEKSILTAIRPLDAAICDACGQELEGISFDEIRQCDGEDCDITFCSQDCKERAVKGYHRPYLEQDETDDDDENDSQDEDEDTENSPNHTTTTNEDQQSTNTEDTTNSNTTTNPAPFCSNTDLQTIGRPLSPPDSTTAEWDLYFLLLTRTISMSITQNIHPLLLPETKYLWGSFTPSPFSSVPTTSTTTPHNPHAYIRTLPFSLSHTITQPLDFFTILNIPPYSPLWLSLFDSWILQTLFSKFRAVANATQSTFDGLPETASVHAGWCLANHDCAPNVRWTPSGVRRFFVVDDDENGGGGDGNESGKRKGIKRGEEVYSHYTDVRLPVKERRERLRGVLGGLCRCGRCVREMMGEMPGTARTAGDM